MLNEGVIMGWNNPDDNNKGNNNNSWNKKEEGPPDLEQIFKKMFGKLCGIGGNNKLPPSIEKLFGGGLFFIVLVIVYTVAGFYTVQPAEEAVVTRFGRYNRVETPGIHWIPRFIEERYNTNIRQENISKHGGLMLTRDENIVAVEISVQYRVNDSQEYLFNMNKTVNAMQQVADSALRDVIGQSNLDYVLTDGREEVGIKIRENIQNILGEYKSGLIVSDVAIQSIRPPEEVRDSFNDVTRAREERERLINKATAYKNERLPKSEANAKSVLEDAEAYKQERILGAKGNTQRFANMLPEYKKAKEITKKRLYLETMEGIFSSTSKVILDGDNNNGLIYLPIDKIMENNAKKLATTKERG